MLYICAMIVYHKLYVYVLMLILPCPLSIFNFDEVVKLKFMAFLTAIY